MAAAMSAARGRLDAAAGNLANVSTNGFERVVASGRLSGGGIALSTAVDRKAGPLERTGRAFDLTVAERGAFLVRDGARIALVRSASFFRDARGRLADAQGRVLLGRYGALRTSDASTIDARGVVRDRGRELDRVRVVPGTTVRSGFLMRSNVDAVREMVDVLAAERSFETAQKALSALDDARAKDAGDVARIKS